MLYQNRIKTCARGLVATALLIALAGCARDQYRVQADTDAHALIAERNNPTFRLTPRSVSPASHSRMADFADPDCGPLPPDDPAAKRFMDQPYKTTGSDVWVERGELTDVEFDHWRELLPVDEEGAIRLNRESAMELALLHGRAYQTQVENVYLTALPVSLERFAFDTQWAGGAGLNFLHNGGFTRGSTRTLIYDQDLGFSKRFAGGGQLLADLSNILVWEYNNGVSSAASQLSFRFLQPLMRRAFKEVQLEPLTQAERNLLYSVRDFARFRRTFYVDTVGDNGYLGLLSVAQAIRNEQANLTVLRRNLNELQADATVSQFQIDQVAQQYDQGRLSLLQAQAGLQTALDQYKLTLGLPPRQPMVLDSDELKLFELNAPSLVELGDRNEAIRLELVQFVDKRPNRETLISVLKDVEAVTAHVPDEATLVRDELTSWMDRLDRETKEKNTASLAPEKQREIELAKRLDSVLEEIETKLADDADQLKNVSSALTSNDEAAAWAGINELCGKQLRARLADLFVVQTQVRVYLIETRPLEISETAALHLARMNRLDLKNVQGQVVDAYRRTEVAADLLEADLDLALGADLGTDPGRNNLLRFDSSASQFSAGLRFDGPLNRMAERNSYRARQIEYQQARRNYMEAVDNIEFNVRNTLRNLNLNRFQFEITRQQLITAARQVEQAQANLRSVQDPGSNLTRDFLQALGQLRDSRNNLISSWVNYETSRMQVQSVLGVLEVDDNGRWMNDGMTFEATLGAIPTDIEIGFEKADDDAENDQ